MTWNAFADGLVDPNAQQMTFRARAMVVGDLQTIQRLGIHGFHRFFYAASHVR